MDVAPMYQLYHMPRRMSGIRVTMTADENDLDMNDFDQQVVSLDDANYLDSDNGSGKDLDSSRSEGAYCVVSDDGSAADLDVDMLDIEDYDNSDVWSITDLVVTARTLVRTTIVCQTLSWMSVMFQTCFGS